MKKFIVSILVSLILIVGVTPSKEAYGMVRRGYGYSQNDVTIPSGMTEKEIRTLLPARMKCLSGTLYEIEHKKNPINAIFLMSVIKEESGNGTSRLYNQCNNVAGIKRGGRYTSFRSKREALLYMHDFLNRLYIKRGRKSVWRIGPMYCGPHWAGTINSHAVTTLHKAWKIFG